MIDIDTHKMIDLIPSREWKDVQQWLESYPNLTHISRDGSITYKKAIDMTNPKIIQISDRFHLIKNLIDYCKEALKYYLPAKLSFSLAEKHVPSIIVGLTPKQKAVKAQNLSKKGVSQAEICRSLSMDTRTLSRYLRLTSKEMAHYFTTSTEKYRQERQLQKNKRIQQVLKLHNEGISQRKISKQTGLSRNTIRRYISFPELAKQPYKRPERAKKMDAFHTLLVDEVMKNKTAKDIYKVLVEKGFTGGESTTRSHVRKLKQQLLMGEKAGSQRMKSQLVISRHHLVQLLYNPAKSALTKRQLALVFSRYPIVEKIIESVKQFRQLIKAKKSDELSNWMTQVKTANFYGVARFLNGLSRDIDAVKNAIIYDYNNGLAEGFVNKIKVIKRVMYGRNHFDMLRVKLLSRGFH